jgi:hypothetical protein
MSDRKSNSKTANEFRRTKSEGVSEMSNKNSKTKANEFCWTSGVVKTGSLEENKLREIENSESSNEFRWAVEFMAGPGGYLEKAEIVSRWFETIDDAKDDAFQRVDNEVCDYPYSRGKILKLVVEDKHKTTEIELKNVTKDVPRR